MVKLGPVADPETGELSGNAAAKRYTRSGLSVFYLDPVMSAPVDSYTYSDGEAGLVVIGGSEGKSVIWPKILAHELGHVILEEYNAYSEGNLMSDGADELKHPSFALTPAQCGKARAYVSARWPVSP